MLMDPSYIGPLPTAATLRAIRGQEPGCFLWCWGVAALPPILLQRTAIPFALHAYATAVVVILLNSLRTLGSHRWRNAGGEMTFIGQLLDSVNYPNHALATELWAPVGSRFHALHHLFPSMPYHEMARAHRKLMTHLPEDSPYRITNAPSLAATLARLWRDTTIQNTQNNQQRLRPHHVTQGTTPVTKVSASGSHLPETSHTRLRQPTNPTT